eukprot:gene11118-3937_t
MKKLVKVSKSSLDDDDYSDLGEKLSTIIPPKEILILGTGEAGTSTLFKQFRYLSKENLYEKEAISTKNFIENNIIEAMYTIVKYCQNHGISTPVEGDIKLFDKFENIPVAEFHNYYNVELYKIIQELWKDEKLKEIFTKCRYTDHIPENAEIFLNEIERFCPTSDYKPTLLDSLLYRRINSGIIEVSMSYENDSYKIYDVSGQTNERKKWSGLFNTTMNMIFVCSLSEYDEKMYEDDETNRLFDSIQCFKECVNHEFFRNTKIFLLFTKKDLFEKKIQTVKLSESFPEYQDDNNAKNAFGFIKEQFLKQLDTLEEDRIKIYSICTLNNDEVKKVLKNILNSI